MNRARRIAMALLIACTPALAQETPDGGTVPYRSFDSNDPTVYSLRKFNGRHTALLISQSTLDAVGIARVRKTIDEHDMLYSAFREIIGGEPAGEGLMRVAVFEDASCTAACAQGIGLKSLEVNSGFFNWPDYLHYAIHEFAHAFDLHGPDVFVASSGPPGHEWTSFWQHYMQFHLGMPELDLNASDYLDYQVRKNIDPYEARAGSTWESCIRDQACPTGNPDYVMSESAQGGAVLRLAQIYGKAFVKAWIPAYKAILAERGGIRPGTDLARSELLIESLSRAARADLSCAFDAWRWPMSSSLRGRLAAHGPNPLCADWDGDGHTPLKRDCDDRSAGVHPGAAEAMNGRDDDCDGMVDNSVVRETTPFPSSQDNPLPITLPVRIEGNAPSFAGNVRDCFQFTLNAPESIRLTFDSKETFRGWAQIRRPHSENDYDLVFTWSNDIRSYKTDLPAGSWDLCVTVDQEGHAQAYGGDYVLSVQKAYAFPMAEPLLPLTFTPAPATPAMGNVLRLPKPATPSSLAGLPDLSVHYWVAGFGDIGSFPASSPGPLSWTAPQGADVLGSVYRVKYHSAGLPAHPWSQGQSLLGPVAWNPVDIGSTGLAGSTARYGERDLALTGSGADIWGAADAFHFAYLPLNGNGEVVAKVHTLANTHSSAKAGIMLRETLQPGSRNVFLGLKPSAEAFLSVRSATSGTTSVPVRRAGAFPTWFKLARVGNVFTASTSTDGAAWTVLGSPVTVAMAGNGFAGLAVTSHVIGIPATAGFAGARVRSTALSLSGRITSSSGASLSGVTVSLSGAKTASAQTDASGNYAFSGLRHEDSYTVTPTKAGQAFTPAKRDFPVLKSSATGAFTGAAAPGCVDPAWSGQTVYVAGNLVSHLGKRWRAKWWTLNEQPGTTGVWGVWEDLGPC